jgi:prevent-host-death family protein
MKIAPLAEAKSKLSALVAPEQRDPVLITRNGKPAAVLVPVPADVEIEDLALSFSPKFNEILAHSRQSFMAGRGIPADEFRRMIEEDSRQMERKPRQRRRLSRPRKTG